jgi:hypothetical protein
MASRSFAPMPGLYRTYHTLPRLTSLYREDNLGALRRILHQRTCKNKLFLLRNIWLITLSQLSGPFWVID